MTAPNLWYQPTPGGPTVAMHVADPMAALLHFQALREPRWATEVDTRANEIIERNRRLMAAEADARPQPTRPAPEPLRAAAAPARTGVRLTSHAAIARMRASGELNARQAQLLDWLMQHGSPDGYTRQELARGMGWGVNQVCGRVHELIKTGILAEREPRQCRATGNTANAVVLAA